MYLQQNTNINNNIKNSETKNNTTKITSKISNKISSNSKVLTALTLAGNILFNQSSSASFYIGGGTSYNNNAYKFKNQINVYKFFIIIYY